MKPLTTTSSYRHRMTIAPICLFITLILFPFTTYSQDRVTPPDTAHIQSLIRHYSTIHSAGIGLCVGGALFTAGGAFIILPTLGDNGTHSVSNQTLGLSLVVGGLAVMMSGLIVIGQSGAKIRSYKQQLEGLSVGINPDPQYPGLIFTYRFR